MSSGCLNQETAEYDLLLIAHSSDAAFAESLHRFLTEDYGLSVFYGEASTGWGNCIFTTLNKAVRRSKTALVIVSRNFLDSKASQDVISAMRERVSVILPVLFDDVAETYFKKKQCLLAQRQALRTSRNEAKRLANDVARRLAASEAFVAPRLSNPNGIPWLPRLAPGFGGRTKEIDLVYKNVISEDVAVISIRGPPGVGKSMLATAVGKKLLDEGRKVTFVSVADYESQDQYAGAILEALGSQPQLGHEFQELEALSRKSNFRSHVLILDGCDKILKSHRSQFLSLLCVLCRLFDVITTSWRCFDLSQLKMVPVSVDRLTVSSAVKVLSSLCPNIKKADAENLVRLCGCMPIAIQIIGATLKTVFTPEQFLTSLKEASAQATFVAKLDSFAETVLSKDSSVTMCFETAFRSLPEDLQEKLTCLSLFRASFTEEEAADVLDATDLLETVLLPLEQHSLLLSVSKKRFQLHSLIRKFLKERCNRSENAVSFNGARIRFCEFYCRRLRETAALYEEDARSAVRKFQRDRPNFVQLLYFAKIPEIVSSLREMYVRLALDTVPLLKATLSHEARKSFLKSSAEAASGESDLGAQSRLQLFTIEAILDDIHPDISEARQLLKSAEKSAADVNDTLLPIHCHIMETQILLSDFHSEEAFRLMKDKVLGHYNRTLCSHPSLKSAALVAFGNAAEETGDVGLAIMRYKEALEYCSFSHGDVRGSHPEICAIQMQIARCLFEREKYDESEMAYAQVRKMQVQLSCDRLSLATTQYQLCIATACAFREDQTKQQGALNILQEVEEEVKRLKESHPLLLLAPLAAGKILFCLGMSMSNKDSKKKKQRKEQAGKVFNTSQSHIERALSNCENMTIDVLDNSELKMECLAYLSVLDVLLPRNSDVQQGHEYRRQCCTLREEFSNGIGVTVTSPIVDFVTSEGFPSMCTTFTAVRLAFKAKNVQPRFTGCLSILLRRNMDSRMAKELLVRSYSQMPRARSRSLAVRANSVSVVDRLVACGGRRRSLNSAILSQLIYPSPKKLSKLRKVNGQSEINSPSLDAMPSPELERAGPRKLPFNDGSFASSDDESDFCSSLSPVLSRNRRVRTSSLSSSLSDFSEDTAEDVIQKSVEGMETRKDEKTVTENGNEAGHTGSPKSSRPAQESEHRGCMVQ
eukprot:m.9602 g.9602  ORF g.9602 m.9602 type:complete len:1158 (+) comp21490_c0_seq1:146-3619(+)